MGGPELGGAGAGGVEADSVRVAGSEAGSGRAPDGTERDAESQAAKSRGVEAEVGRGASGGRGVFGGQGASGERGVVGGRGVDGRGRAVGEGRGGKRRGGKRRGGALGRRGASSPWEGAAESSGRDGAEASGEGEGRRERGGSEEGGSERGGLGEGAAREVCLRMLAGAPRTRAQLADALRRKGFPDDVAESVLSRFTDVGLIDDEAFAQAWVRSRHAGRGLAKRALAAELRRRGVAGETVNEAVETLEPEQEERTARALVERKLRSTRGVDPVKRTRRLVGMLARKGYPPGLSYRVVKEALAEEGADLEDFPEAPLE
ncbi:regulatory protein RecX [Actinomadura litoris]